MAQCSLRGSADRCVCVLAAQGKRRPHRILKYSPVYGLVPRNSVNVCRQWHLQIYMLGADGASTRQSVVVRLDGYSTAIQELADAALAQETVQLDEPLSAAPMQSVFDLDGDDSLAISAGVVFAHPHSLHVA